ncbi:EamA family transporter [Candidatus Woesearchaeota archaeon]|nr:EamA family transporter [Candidatus Woesearchaeota archaeon]
MPAELWSIALVLLASFLGSFGPIFIKKGSAKASFSIRALLSNYHLLFGFFLYAVGTALFIPALKGGSLSVLYPLVSTTYIWVALWSMILLKEKMNVMKWAGIAVIIIGVSLIGIGG